VKPRNRSEMLLLSLALAGGFVDVASYIGLGKVFTANMTGNTVLFGVALAKGSGADAIRAATALGGFCLGGALGMVLIPQEHRGWPRTVLRPLLLESVSLAALLVLWAAIGAQSIRSLLVVIAGVAMGSQSAAVRVSDVRGVNTTFMTSTLLNAIELLVHKARGIPAARDAPNLPGAAWLTYGGGAVAGAFAVDAWDAGVIAVPLAIVAVVSGIAFRENRRLAHP